jgi:hypothetical protein
MADTILEPILLLARQPTKHDVVSLGRLFQQSRDGRRRVLAVVVHGHDPGAARLGETGEVGAMLAVVPQQPQGLHLGDLVGNPGDDTPAVVGTAVVDEDDLIRSPFETWLAGQEVE